MRCVYEMDYYGEYCVATMDCLVGGGVDYSAPTFAALENFWEAIAAPLSQDLTLQVIKLDQVSITSGVTGAGTDPALPGNCALRILKNNPGRPGSMNLPGILEDQVAANGLIPGPTHLALVGILNSAFDDLNTAGVEMVVTSELGALRVVSSISPSTRIGTFRNRMYGR